MAIMSLVRKTIESMYIGTCDVIEYQKSIDPVTKKSGFVEVPVLLAQPCRVSFKDIKSTGDGNTAGVTQQIKLFVAPEVIIKEGSKIEVTQNGRKETYANSGKPAVYETHQEIILTLFDRWS